MPKKRKTRKEKILHDQKKQTVPQVTPSAISSAKNETPAAEPTTVSTGTFSLPTTQAAPEKIKETPQTVSISTNNYGYLTTDLMRTALLTGAIVFAELLIRLFFVH